MPRREELYLVELVEAADALGRFLRDVSLEAWIDNELLQAAVLQKLTVMGEAAARTSEAIQARYPDIPWRGIQSFRNLAVHEYFSIEWQQVWQIARESAPDARAAVLAVLVTDFPLVAKAYSDGQR